MSSEAFELNSLISFHNWSLKSNENKEYRPAAASDVPEINFHVIKYSDKSLYVWIGDSNGHMDNLACSMQSTLERDPIGIEIMQPHLVESRGVYANLGKDISVKLSKRLRKQVFVSFNVSQNLLELADTRPTNSSLLESNEPEVNLMNIIEKSLYGEIKSKPEFF